MCRPDKENGNGVGSCSVMGGNLLVDGSDRLIFPFYRLLIEFSEDPDSPSWKGYTLATGLLVVKFIQVFSNRQLHSIYYLNITLRVRSALTAAIYKKVNKL